MTTSDASGLFIVFEGGEGCGKSTQVALLTEYLSSDGIAVTATREPGSGPLGVKIRAMLLDPDVEDVAPRAEALLYAADRAQHVHTLIQPALTRGDVVVCDRYIDSSLAYQGAARGHGVERIRDLSLWAASGLTPDLTFLLDLDPEVGLARAGKRAVLDRFEREALTFHLNLSAAFRGFAAAEPHRYEVLDASQTPEVTAAQIRAHIALRYPHLASQI